MDRMANRRNSNGQQKLLTYHAIFVFVHDCKHPVSHETQTVGSNQTERLLIALQAHKFIDCERFEPFSELVNLIVVHLKSSMVSSDFGFDIDNGLLQPALTNFCTATE